MKVKLSNGGISEVTDVIGALLIANKLATPYTEPKPVEPSQEVKWSVGETVRGHLCIHGKLANEEIKIFEPCAQTLAGEKKCFLGRTLPLSISRQWTEAWYSKHGTDYFEFLRRKVAASVENARVERELHKTSQPLNVYGWEAPKPWDGEVTFAGGFVGGAK